MTLSNNKKSVKSFNIFSEASNDSDMLLENANWKNLPTQQQGKKENDGI